MEMYWFEATRQPPKIAVLAQLRIDTFHWHVTVEDDNITIVTVVMTNITP